MNSSRTEVDLPQVLSLAEFIEAQVQRTPGACAVVHGNHRLTYSELNSRANQLARELCKHDAGPNQLVAVCVERSTDLTVALLAIVKAGAAYLPLDFVLPLERIQYMLEDSGVRLLITQKSLQAETLEFLGTRVLLEDIGWRSNPSDNLEVAVGPEDLAYVIYTSGSTGKPKGVEIPRGALLNLLWAMRELLQFSERDRLLSVITISFDPAGIDVWLPLLTGACTVFASREAAADGNALCGLLDRHDITAMQATPMTWRLLFNAGWRGKPNLKAVCGGEVMPPELAAELVSSAKQVWNMYGPTEATVSSTCYEVMNTEEIIPIGRPIANKHCYILDEQGQPVPVGVTGELFIGGDGLARGYLNRPKLTQEKFVPDPFRGGLARMYSTGDLARYRADGNIDCLGRVDHQVKIRGYRTELGEIEAALEDHPTITQVVVIAHTDTHGDKQLVAYIETGAGVALDLRELRNSLKRKLPEYMVPSAYVLLKQLPISPNGKIDRNALPPPDSAKQADRTDARELGPPCNPVEEKIAAIFSRQLGVSAVGATDDFFDLGGHSLKAARSIALLNEEFGTGIPVRVLFQAHTARQLAAVIDRTDKSDEEPWPVLIPIQPRGTRPPLFCVARPSVNALGYLMLSREMGGEQPVFGLQIKLGDDPDMDFAKEQFISTAITYIEAIKTVQPHGPYNLIGECQGTFIAFEMARRLEAAGEEVSLFGVLDTWPEENTRHRSLFHLHVALQGLRMMDRETPLRVIRKFLSKFLLPLMSHSQTNSPAKRAPSGMETLEQRYWPGKDFRQEMCFCPITVFRANEQMWYRIRDEELGWGNRTRGGVTVMRIAGTHPMLLRPPYVQEVAAFLAEELRVASERHALAYGEALAASL